MNKSDSGLFSILDKVDSTNNYAMARIRRGVAKDGSCWFTTEQTRGRGQRGKSWKANRGDSAAMSIVLKPNSAFKLNPFTLNALISVTTLKYFVSKTNCLEFCIKWPNDIYWNDKKAAGMLLENIYFAKDWNWCVAGIGINVNHSSFPSDLPNAISLKNITQISFDPGEIAHELYLKIIEKINDFRQEDTALLLEEYNNSLYQRGKWVKFKKDNRVFESKVIEVNLYGELITEDVMERQFHFGELQWVLESE